MKTPRISAIAALGKETRVIGNNNKLLWNLPEDLRHFKNITSGHPVIMGRKTWESIPEKFRPLPNRTNIVVTRQDTFKAPGAQVAHSLHQALEIAQTKDSEEILIIGGEQIYAQALPHTKRLYLTLVEADTKGDVFFPDYTEFSKEISREKNEENGLAYTWLTVERPV